MRYLEHFLLPDGDAEYEFEAGQRRTCYSSHYPFGLFPRKGLRGLELEPITILYGGNGSGKTTLLNVMAQRLALARGAPYNGSAFFGTYTELCQARTSPDFTPEVHGRSRIITSDDVFDYLFDLRGLNDGIDKRREELLAEYTDVKYARFQMHSMDDYDQLKKVTAARRRSGSGYVRERLMDNLPAKSNGESALLYFTHAVGEGGLYLLDEPENSLSAENEQKLAAFLTDSVRFFDCQLVISTHSPFLLALRGAQVWDLDGSPAHSRSWTELPSVRAYHRFFEEHRDELKGDIT